MTTRRRRSRTQHIIAVEDKRIVNKIEILKLTVIGSIGCGICGFSGSDEATEEYTQFSVLVGSVPVKNRFDAEHSAKTKCHRKLIATHDAFSMKKSPLNNRFRCHPEYHGKKGRARPAFSYVVN